MPGLSVGSAVLRPGHLTSKQNVLAFHFETLARHLGKASHLEGKLLMISLVIGLIMGIENLEFLPKSG